MSHSLIDAAGAIACVLLACAVILAVSVRSPLALLLAALGAAGCTGPVVEVGRGHGAAIGPRQVLTLEHVCPGEEALVDGRPAWVLERRPGRPEGLVVLGVPWRRGPWALVREARPGDSGTPLVAADGCVLGLLVGARRGELVVAPACGGDPAVHCGCPARACSRPCSTCCAPGPCPCDLPDPTAEAGR